MRFKDIFKSQDQRKLEEIERQADFERTNEATEKLYRDTFRYIDFYFDRVSTDEAEKAIKNWRDIILDVKRLKIENNTKEKIIETKNNILTEEFNKFKLTIERLDRDLKEKCRNGLKDLKQALIQQGDMDMVDKYIFKNREILIEEIILFAKDDLTLISLEIANLATADDKMKDIEFLNISLKSRFCQNRSVKFRS